VDHIANRVSGHCLEDAHSLRHQLGHVSHILLQEHCGALPQAGGDGLDIRLGQHEVHGFDTTRLLKGLSDDRQCLCAISSETDKSGKNSSHTLSSHLSRSLSLSPTHSHSVNLSPCCHGLCEHLSSTLRLEDQLRSARFSGQDDLLSFSLCDVDVRLPLPHTLLLQLLSLRFGIQNRLSPPPLRRRLRIHRAGHLNVRNDVCQFVPKNLRKGVRKKNGDRKRRIGENETERRERERERKREREGECNPMSSFITISYSPIP
jgi:hypothetical protein